MLHKMLKLCVTHKSVQSSTFVSETWLIIFAIVPLTGSYPTFQRDLVDQCLKSVSMLISRAKFFPEILVDLV